MSNKITLPTSSPFTHKATLISQAGASLTQRQNSQPRQPPPAVETWTFKTERQQAFDPQVPSGVVLLDRSKHLRLSGPGTTPSLLAAYIKINATERVTTCFQGGLEFYYVIRGEGRSYWGEERIEEHIAWQAGDLFFLPSGQPVHHQSLAADGLLYVVSDQPLAQFLRLTTAQTNFEPLHYLATEVEAAQQSLLQETGSSGVIHFGQERQFVYSAFLPTWKWIVPGEHQLPHRHAAVAVQLFVAGKNSYSIIDDDHIDWQDYTVAISPAGSLHSHHNVGDDLGIYLVAQDFPLHRYLRTYWYEEPESSVHRTDWQRS